MPKCSYLASRTVNECLDGTTFVPAGKAANGQRICQ